MLPRPNDSHKGNYGHLLLVCGSNAYSGAAVLATGAALKSGCGLVTLHSCARALQATVNKYPSAMLSEDPAGHFSVVPERLERFSAIAVGPGLGQDPETLAALEKLMGAAKRIPDGSVLAPHPGELKRLEESGAFADDGPCLEDIGWVLVKKGWHTRITTSSGEAYVNTTGNAGMAKGGSGDVLTGLIGGLLARGYRALDAALLGVWIHGFAGDRLSEECTPEAYSSLDLIEALYNGFKELY